MPLTTSKTSSCNAALTLLSRPSKVWQLSPDQFALFLGWILQPQSIALTSSQPYAAEEENEVRKQIHAMLYLPD